MKYDFAVLIGRFSPYHAGHERIVKLALKNARKLILLIGSSNQHRSPRNPFSFKERASMMGEEVSPAAILPIEDHPYNETAWIAEVQRTVQGVIDSDRVQDPRITLVGYRKDESSYYQGLFPEWDYSPVQTQYGTFNATDIRDQYLQDSPIISEFLSTRVRTFLREFAFTPEFKWLVNEKKFLDDYHKTWGRGPFVTTDALCVQAGQVLLVTRKNPPYAGTLALPGGFLEPNERIVDCCVRELREETRISDHKGEIPPGMLRSFITETKVFDSPNRSQRGRIITHLFKFEFPNLPDGPYKVRGDDDAEFAQWYNLSDLRKDSFMEDHAHIIESMTGVKLK